jgi:hypothetical protein
LFPQHYIDEKNPCVEFYRTRLDELAGDTLIDPNDEIILDPNTSHCCSGDVLLWDSRVVHCSYPVLGAALTTRPAELLLLQTG